MAIFPQSADACTACESDAQTESASNLNIAGTHPTTSCVHPAPNQHPHSSDNTYLHNPIGLLLIFKKLELDQRKIVPTWKLVHLRKLPHLYPSSFPTSPPRSQRSNSPCESPRELCGPYELCRLHLLCFTSWHRSSSFWTSLRRYSCELHTARLRISSTRRSRSTSCTPC